MTKEKTESNMKSVDDLIVKFEQEKLGKIMPEIPVNKAEEKKEESESPVIEDKIPHTPEEKSDEPEELVAEKEELSEEEQAQESDNKPSEASSDDDVDEYGTKVGKKKLYTEDEVQRMIRERLKRGQQSDSSQQQVVQQAAKDFTPDPESDESWETQLESFVEKTVQKINQKQANAEWKRQEEQTQAEFEVKFSEGMAKYKDFNTIVAGKPITNAMMLATRTMKDPAAFLYAACKQQPKELSRIAAMTDIVAQATEIGRLEERMKRAKAVTSGPRPATRVSGDASSEMPQLDIDARIASHAKSKIMR